MNVEGFRQRLALLPRVLDERSLPDELRDAVAASPECRALLEERVRQDHLLELLPELEPRAGAARAICAAARAERPRPGTLLRRRAALIAAAAAAAVVVAVLLGRGRSGDGTDTPREVASAPDPEMLEQLELLLDWDEVVANGSELDLLASNELAAAVDALDEDAGEELPR